jgi:acylphosphatase
MAGSRQKMVRHKEAFCGFDIKQVVRLTDADVAEMLKNPEVIRHRGKIQAVIQNARNFQAIEKVYGSFPQYLSSLDKSNNYAAVVKDLIAKFKWLGLSSAKTFLYTVGEDNRVWVHKKKSGLARQLFMPKASAHSMSREESKRYFRQNTKNQAQKQGLTGWVRNVEDGEVEAVFEGEESAVKTLVEYCHHGPRDACVTKVSVDWEPFRGESQTFSVIY